MTTAFDRMTANRPDGNTAIADPRVSPAVVEAIKTKDKHGRTAFHQMVDELETDASPLLSGVFERPVFIDREADERATDSLRPMINDAIADIVAADPNVRRELERGDQRVQSRVARSTISRMVSAGERFEPRNFITAFKDEVGKRVVDPTAGEKVGEFGQRILAGATSVIATGEAGAASVFDNASKKVSGPLGTYFKWASEGLDLRAAQVLSDIQKDYAGDPRLESNAFWSTLPETIGSFGGFVAISSVTGGMVGGTVLAGAVGIGESRQRRQYVVSQGLLSPEEGVEAELLGAIPGVLQIVPLFHALKGFGGKSAVGLRRGISRTLAEGAVVGLEESIVETLGEVGQDAIEKWQFDPNKAIGENAIETAKISGAGGFVVGVVASAIRGARIGRYRRPPTEEGFTQDDAKRIIDDGLALEASAQKHIDESKKAADPSRQALEFLRLNTSNVEFVKLGKKQIVDQLIERFGLSKRRARRVYLRVKEGYDLVRLSEEAGQPVEVIKQAQDLVNESIAEVPGVAAAPLVEEEGAVIGRNVFGQLVREDLYKEFRDELTELDIEQEPLGQTLPRGIPARFLVSETTGETLPIPLSPFPVVVRGEIGELGLREHRESVSFRESRLMDLFEANTLAELLQEANPDDAFAVHKFGEDDWRVYFKRAETTTLFEQEPARGEEIIQPEAEEAPGVAGEPERPPAGPEGEAEGGAPQPIPKPPTIPPGGRGAVARIVPPIKPERSNVPVKFKDLKDAIEGIGQEFQSPIESVDDILTARGFVEVLPIDGFALHPDDLDGLSEVEKLRVSKQFRISEEATEIPNLVGQVLYNQALDQALNRPGVRDNLNRITELILAEPQRQNPDHVLASIMFQDRQFQAAAERAVGRDHYRQEQLPVGATFDMFGVAFEITDHEGVGMLLHSESQIALPIADISTLIAVDRGTLKIPAGQPGLLGEQFAGPITGRQAELPLPEPSALGREVEAEQARAREALEADETAELFPQTVPKIVPFDDALTEAPPGLEFTGSAMPEGDVRGNLLQAFQEDPNEARLFAEAIGIEKADTKSPEQIINEFVDTRKDALESPDDPTIEMLYSGIPIPDHLPQLITRGVAETVRPVINNAFVDLIDRLRRVSDDPLIQDAAASARLASLDAKGIIGELSPLLDPLLRMTGKNPLTAEGKATQRLQQIQWDDNGDGGVSLFHLALEDKLPQGVTLSETEQLIIDKGKDLIAFGGRLHEREGTLRFNQRTQEWEPFQQTGRAVAPRISTLELFDVIARGEGDRFESLVRLIAENPENRALLVERIERKAGFTAKELAELPEGTTLVVEATPEELVRNILLEQRSDMMGLQGEPSAFRRINAEFMRIWPYFPTIIKDNITGARVQLIENNPFHYFERYANLTAGRLSFVRHFGQETEAPSLVNKLVDTVQNRRGGSDEVVAVTRALHGLPVERTFWTTPGSAPHQIGIALRHASSILKAGALSMTWPQNLLEFLGRILGIAGGPAKRDFWVAMGNMYTQGGERRAATLSALRGLGAVDNWIRNLSIDPNRPGESAARITREIPTVLVRVFWKEQSRLAAAIGLAKSERMAAGRGKESDVQDVMSMLGFDRPTAEAMKRGEGTPEQYLMIARRAGAYTTNQPMVKAEQSRAEHSRIFRNMFAFTTYAFMGVRWLASNIRTTMPIMRDLWRNPKDKTAWNRARVNVTKLAGQSLGLTVAGGGSYFLLALATGGVHGLKLAWREAAEDPKKFLLDSFLYTTFAGPFGSLLRLTQNQSRNRFESIIRMTWPGAIMIELTDFTASTGRYRDREFFGRDGKLMRLTDRFVPINRMVWQGLAVIGIGADQQDLRTTIRAYWRARQEISPILRSQAGEPEIEELQEAFESNRQFRIKMRLAHEAMLRGDNPQEFINDAFGADLTKKPSDAARAIRRFRLLTGKFADESSVEFHALRSRIGDDAILILRQHDQLLNSVADSINPKTRSVNYRPVPQRTLNGAANRYRR